MVERWEETCYLQGVVHGVVVEYVLDYLLILRLVAHLQLEQLDHFQFLLAV